MAEWDKRQYLVPTNPAPVGTQSRALCVPDDTDWIATVTGALRELILRENWNVTSEDGGEADVDAAVDTAYQMYLTWVFQTCAGGGMSCEDVADCIETNEAVAQAIYDRLTEAGYSADNGDTPPTLKLTPAQTSENLLPSSASCDDPNLFAICRAIISEMNEALTDLMQKVEFWTNPAELTGELGENVEGVSYAALIPDFFNWLQETVAETYLAAYTDEVEDILSCALWCLAKEECKITHDMIIAAMVDVMGSIEPPASTDDYVALIEWALTLESEISAAFVAAIYYFSFQLVKFNAGWLPQFTGLIDVREVINSALGYVDYSYTECECATETPTSQWALLLNFQISKYGTFQSGVLGEYIGNAGWRSVPNANPAHLQIIKNLGSAFVTRAAGMRIQGRGFTGAAGDALRMAYWTLPNATGTEGGIATQSGLGAPANVNSYEYAQLNLLNGVASQSYKWSAQNVGASAFPTNFVQQNMVVLWGIPDGLGNKPDGSVWMPAMPATTAEIFGLLGL